MLRVEAKQIRSVFLLPSWKNSTMNPPAGANAPDVTDALMDDLLALFADDANITEANENFQNLSTIIPGLLVDDVTTSTETSTGLLFRSTYQQSRTNPGSIIMGPGFSNDGFIYTGRGGRSHCTHKPPPFTCFNCDGPHWRKNCPFRNTN